MPFVLALILLLPLPGLTAPVESHAVVFMYHRFGEDRYPSTSVRLAQFDAHLDWLARNGYQVWPLEEIVLRLERKQTIPDRLVAITVDDAYLSVYREAWPRLAARGWPMTVFVSSDAVDGRGSDYMTWEQMRELQRGGVRFANHGASHGYLWRRLRDETEAAWIARTRADIDKGQQRLQQELGRDVNEQPRLFAYPYGEFDTALADLVRNAGYVAFGQHSGVIGTRSDRRALPRFPMAEAFASLPEFAQKAAALPLPLRWSKPFEPLTRENPPVLELELDGELKGLSCYEGGAPLQVTRIGASTVRVQAERMLSPGRARYNCTAPAGSGRYYWFSQPWIVSDR